MTSRGRPRGQSVPTTSDRSTNDGPLWISPTTNTVSLGSDCRLAPAASRASQPTECWRGASELSAGRIAVNVRPRLDIWPSAPSATQRLTGTGWTPEPLPTERLTTLKADGRAGAGDQPRPPTLGVETVGSAAPPVPRRWVFRGPWARERGRAACLDRIRGEAARGRGPRIRLETARGVTTHADPRDPERPT